MVGENHRYKFNTMVKKMIDFGECLKKAQKEKGVSSSELARRLEVHRQQMSIWRAQKNCRLDTAIRICNVLGYKVDEFISL